jgi:hypothetical protein
MLFAIGFGAATMMRGDRPNASTNLTPLAGRAEEIAVVLIVSPSCAASNHPDLIPAWSRLVNQIREATASDVALIGVSLSARARGASDFLSRFGEFHEMNAGGSWFSTASLRYITDELRGPAVLPQVVVIRRQYARRDDGRRYIVNEHVERRVWGLEAIVAASK